MDEENKDNFKDFKNLYEVTKTVRFELKPSKKQEFSNGDIEKLLDQFKKIKESFLGSYRILPL